MEKSESLQKAVDELAEGIAHDKCHACSCMHEGLTPVEEVLEQLGDGELSDRLAEMREQLEPVEVDCRGCSYCYPAEAVNSLPDLSPEAIGKQAEDSPDGNCGCEQSPADETQSWPPVAGNYRVLCTGEDCPVAASTLASSKLVEALADRAPQGLAVVGRTRTENTGVEKLVQNFVANPALRALVLCGKEPQGHRTGRTIKSLVENGLAGDKQVAGEAGPRARLSNLTEKEVRAFRDQVKLVDLIGCTETEKIARKITQAAGETCGCGAGGDGGVVHEETGQIRAEPRELEAMDPAGYFVVTLRRDAAEIVCEHYNYERELQATVVGESAAAIYRELVERDLVSRRDHAAYIGAELARAELALARDLDYEQDERPA